MPTIQLAPLTLPEFGLPTVEPRIPAETYNQRLNALRAASGDHELDAVIVYGDREHNAAIAFLTGYDPRFEETLLIMVNSSPELPLAPSDPTPLLTRMGALHTGNAPALLVGNEGMGYTGITQANIRPVLYQDFSLMAQPRGSNLPLRVILEHEGIRKGSRVGVIGWKHFTDDGTLNTRLEIPAYIVDKLREITEDVVLVVNAGPLMHDVENGLRTINDVDQLASFEFSATHTSQALRNVIFGLEPGMTEYDAARLMQLNGMPHSVHLMLSSGDRARMGLPSPSLKTIELGEPFTVAYGLWGSLNARAGFVARDAGDLPAGIGDYVEKLVTPYFRAAAAWYETIGIGVTGGEVYDAVHNIIGDPFYGVGLNPGHLIGHDEWLHSPVKKGSRQKFKSGMAVQCDIIPATGGPYYTSNIEDGIALADEALRAQFAERYPEAWGRIQARRAFIQDVIGIRLKPEILPFSNIPAYLPPYLLSPQMAMTIR